jgi:predicted ATPase
MPRYVITGGPGAGKTSLLTALGQRNFACSPEISRQLIEENSATGSRCLPWIDLPCFAERAFERMIASYNEAAEQQITFFDRGIPDIIAYLRVAGLEPDERTGRTWQHYPYATTIFLLPPWEQIYIRDDARWQTFEEAATIYHHIATIYRSSGYSVQELPKCPVQQRADLILKMLQL